jgi:hypothetical protein
MQARSAQIMSREEIIRALRLVTSSVVEPGRARVPLSALAAMAGVSRQMLDRVRSGEITPEMQTVLSPLLRSALKGEIVCSRHGQDWEVEYGRAGRQRDGGLTNRVHR